MEIVFLLGQAATAADAQSLIARYRAADLDAVLREVVAHWDDVLGTVQVKTPDRSMDLMLNRWLLYQTLACRMWARSAFYQASGAYGFRDQLQDGMALALSRPALTREHLLRAAARQFVEGRRPALVAAAVRPGRAHAHFRRSGMARATPPRTMSRRPATSRCWTSPFRSSKASRSGPASTTPTSSPCSRTRAHRSSSTARAGSTRASPSASTACR